jgi:hypothetical protein
MSEKKIAASTPYLRTGCMVISTTSSGRMHASSMATPSRILRYSGSERPAWRMYQTGVCGTGSRRAARRKAESWTRGSVWDAAGTRPSSQVRAASRTPACDETGLA